MMSIQNNSLFENLNCLSGPLNQLFEELAQTLIREKNYAKLFEVRLAQNRHHLGLSLDRPPSLDRLAEPLRTEAETAYLQACREVGSFLLSAHRFQEAWLYLQPAGERDLVQTALKNTLPTEETFDDLIVIALHEGVSPTQGLLWSLDRYGICNTLTAFETISVNFSAQECEACSAILVRFLYEELHENLIAHIENHEPSTTLNLEESISSLIAKRDWLFAEECCLTDVSHLATVVGYGRLLKEPADIKQALCLATYGSHLSPTLQYPGLAPFEELYKYHLLYFSALLHINQEAALVYFSERAHDTSIPEEGIGAAEAYITLLSRLGNHKQALLTYIDLIQTQNLSEQLSPAAPTLLELAHHSGDWSCYLSYCQEQDAPLAFVFGLIEKRRPPSNY